MSSMDFISNKRAESILLVYVYYSALHGCLAPYKARLSDMLMLWNLNSKRGPYSLLILDFQFYYNDKTNITLFNN